jgi:hypothetical protein
MHVAPYVGGGEEFNELRGGDERNVGHEVLL